MFNRFVAVIALLTMLAAGTASAHASNGDAGIAAAGKEKATVSVMAWPKRGAFGYVESSRRGCSAGRQVRLFERRDDGSRQLLGSRRTKRTSSGSIWFVKDKAARSGKLTAVATGTARCARLVVKESILPKSGEGPLCPSREPVCFLYMKVSGEDSLYNPYCPNFRKDKGQCKISVTRGFVPMCCFRTGSVRWSSEPVGRRTFRFDSYDNREIIGPSFDGWIQTDTSAAYNVDEVKVPRYFEDPGATWYSPQLPGMKPGTNGGPIYLNWDAKIDTDFDFYLSGFLYKKK